MASLEQIKIYIEQIYKDSVVRYNKLARSQSMRKYSKEQIANMAMNDHLGRLAGRNNLSEGDVALIMKEATRKLTGRM